MMCICMTRVRCEVGGGSGHTGGRRDRRCQLVVITGGRANGLSLGDKLDQTPTEGRSGNMN